jgi:hypothetical protein
MKGHVDRHFASILLGAVGSHIVCNIITIFGALLGVHYEANKKINLTRKSCLPICDLELTRKQLDMYFVNATSQNIIESYRTKSIFSS